MGQSSPLSIATSAVVRLVKEENSYRKELEQQEEHIKRFEGEQGGSDENREYLIKQEVRVLHGNHELFCSVYIYIISDFVLQQLELIELICAFSVKHSKKRKRSSLASSKNCQMLSQNSMVFW